MPKYLQVADDVARQIRVGVLEPGQQIPSESELMARYGVSVGTIRKAMAEIRADGLVETHQGKGSYVRARPPMRRKSSDRFRRAHRRAGRAAYVVEAERSGVAVRVSVLYIGPLAAPEEVAARLGVTAGVRVLARKRLYFNDGVPAEEATSYLPWELAEAVPELLQENPGPGGIYARLEENGHELEEFLETVRVRTAGRRECASLGLSAGAPLIELTRQAVSRGGRVVEVCETVMNADRFVLEYRIPAVD
ncbi:GntR family transcriptional regulator [Streptomyces sp. NBC_00237]|uniref:GntR family transcriptional regulator n=1 Tax=Streptomyces sp. NBC_00237 TaxID=2975687 RepID=UPI00225BDFBD|nr:GntR family transcriptional regulator [Streptomyces sp. NBC_00237]MCX5200163.1 GntR family transcriptional regulator [Streptomyces sp. NBC_00237]